MDMLLRQSPVSLREYYHFKSRHDQHVINEIPHAFSVFNIRTQITERHGSHSTSPLFGRFTLKSNKSFNSLMFQLKPQ